MEARQTETEYVPKNIFDLHMENLKDRAKSEKELTDERFEKFQAILEKNLYEYKAVANEINSRIDKLDTKVDKLEEKIENNKIYLEEKIENNRIYLEEKIENTKIYLEEKIEHVSDALGIEIDGLEKRMNDMHENQNKWFAVFGVLFTVASIALTVAQFFAGK